MAELEVAEWLRQGGGVESSQRVGGNGLGGGDGHIYMVEAVVDRMVESVQWVSQPVSKSSQPAVWMSRVGGQVESVDYLIAHQKAYGDIAVGAGGDSRKSRYFFTPDQ